MIPDDGPPPSSLIDGLLPRCSFPPPGTAVDCAVSGGPDSMSLLVLAAAAGLNVTAIHVDHGLRPGSAREADLVAAASRRLGASFVSRRVVVEDGPNLEARARSARYGALPPGVLTGHTLDDQAETVLMYVMRGTGPEGLAGIDGSNRPLLALRRAETVALCTELGLEVVRDPSNDDARFTRNRVRAEVLPLLDDIAGRDVAPLVARAASLQRHLLDFVEAAAAGIDPTDAVSVAALDPAVASSLMRSWWRSETGYRYAPDAAAVQRMIDVARGRAVGAEVVDGWRIARTARRLRLEPPLGAIGLRG